MIYQLLFLSWKCYVQVQPFLARQLVIITNMCEILKFIVSNTSLGGGTI